MHVLFAHKNFPAHFRHIMPHLVSEHGARCTFISEKKALTTSNVFEQIQYKPRFNAAKSTSYCGRTHENQMWASQAIVEALAARDDLKPDLIVAHSGFFTASFLRELYDCPIVNLFEYFYHPTESDCDFRSDLVEPGLIHRVRTRARNANFLLDLESCDLGYCPTQWQRSLFPDAFQSKLSVAHGGIDTNYWCPAASDEAGNDEFDIPADTKFITYVTRGFESMRGFDIFMKMAKRICDMRDDVVFLVAGTDRVCYGADRAITEGKSFKQWVLDQDNYDLNRIRFLGYLGQDSVRQLYRRSDLHVYLTAPFILSWSALDAMACGCVVLGSDTSPVSEVVEHERNGLLTDFFDVDAMVEQANRVLDKPSEYSGLRAAARETVESCFSVDVCLPRLVRLYSNLMNSVHSA